MITPADNQQPSEAPSDGPAVPLLTETASHGDLLLRLLRFQFKLALDGLRDVVLSPIAIGAVLLGILRAGRSDEPFEAVLRFGRRSDTWIDLFESHAGDPAFGEDVPVANASALFGAVETALRDEYEKNAPRARPSGRGRGSKAPGDDDSGDGKSDGSQ